MFPGKKKLPLQIHPLRLCGTCIHFALDIALDKVALNKLMCFKGFLNTFCLGYVEKQKY